MRPLAHISRHAFIYLRWQRMFIAATTSWNSSVMHTVTSSLRMLNSECAYMAVGRTPAPQHRHVLLTARVPHLCAIQPAASVSTQHPRGACNDDAHPFHCPTLSAPSTSDHATAPRCIPSPPLGVASNHLNASTLMLMNQRAKKSRVTRIMKDKAPMRRW